MNTNEEWLGLVDWVAVDDDVVDVADGIVKWQGMLANCEWCGVDNKKLDILDRNCIPIVIDEKQKLYSLILSSIRHNVSRSKPRYRFDTKKYKQKFSDALRNTNWNIEDY